MSNKEETKTILGCRICNHDLLWQHPTENGMCMASSDFMEDWDICHSCMVEYCTKIDCSNCIIGLYAMKEGGICRFWDMKEYYMTEDEEDGEKEKT